MVDLGKMIQPWTISPAGWKLGSRDVPAWDERQRPETETETVCWLNRSLAPLIVQTYKFISTSSQVSITRLFDADGFWADIRQMSSSDDAIRHPDPLVNARLQSFPVGGDQRHLLETWLNGRSEAAEFWSVTVLHAQVILKSVDRKTAFEEDLKMALHPLNDSNVRTTFLSFNMEPTMLTTLFGNPKDYKVTLCSNWSLAYLLRHHDPVDILIGMFILRWCWTLLKFLTRSDNNAAGKITDHDDVFMSQTPEDQQIEEAALRLNKHFMETYCGPGALCLEKGLHQYMKMYKPEVHYGKSIVILQSSGTGKSRVVAEMTNSQGEEIAAAFMGALFSVLHDTIVDARHRGRSVEEAKKFFDKSWELSDIRGSPRSKNFTKVADTAISLLETHADKILHARLPTTHAKMVSTPVNPDQMEVDDPGSIKHAGGSSPSALKEKPSDHAQWAEELYAILIKPSAAALDQDRVELGLSCFTFAFDECSFLNFHFQPGEVPISAVGRITLLAMQRIIKACEAHGFWYFLLDTTRGLHDVYPDATKSTALSKRLRGDLKPLPAWPYLPFDMMVPPPSRLPKTPLDSLLLCNLKLYGRPLWSMYHDDELMDIVGEKILCDRPENFPSPNSETRKLQILALHSTRFILNLCAEGAANVLAVASVRSHLRVLTEYDAVTRMLKSEVPSEPILAIGAGNLLLKNKRLYIDAMRTLVDELLLSDDVISLGEKGETLARIIIIVNRDATVHEAGGQIQCVVEISHHLQKIAEQTSDARSLGYSRCSAVRPFTLEAYLKNLLKQGHIGPESPAFDSGLKWGEKVYLNFTHFIQLDDFVDADLSAEFLIMCWHRGFALQCVHNQPVIDILLIGYRGDLSKPFNPRMFVLVALQVKNRADPAGTNLIKAITCPFIKFGSQRWKPQYMVILMDLRTSTAFQGGSKSQKVRVAKSQAQKGKTWAAFEEANDYKAV
ncbi:uncharacterized protein LACBIDRAFT_331604 [Laccaria bicolor S238N-H82]|uniref:Predicted protein n=1 Tax=Laccaria bicolor (strain S238N-H82 / ATCC MYA-4686) TaxID=486041 RepID=B0DPZ5_LACBS|nr:uncharacterized protein LACBIDRAFT_331604 [Laccaria bicolor S238N-H82]EDR03297.1 predicted protein [Laccaria bicolor S238N-H82]|eukprot:XP_001886093.1 predicted protein [Laccaria bicolor S238N-H82]